MIGTLIIITINLMGSIIKFIGMIFLLIAYLAYATKPTHEILIQDIQIDIKGGPLTKSLHSYVIATLPTDIRDYLIIKTAKVTFPDGTEKMYLGLFQHWWPINELQI
jgi:hypothetical protein